MGNLWSGKERSLSPYKLKVKCVLFSSSVLKNFALLVSLKNSVLAVCILLDSLILRAFIISRISTGILFNVIRCTVMYMYLCVVREAVLVFVVYEFHHFPSKFKIIIVVTYNVYLYLTMFMMIILELPQTAICLALSLALKSTK